MYYGPVAGELFVWLGDGDVATVGGKAAGLGRLIDAGLPVPPGAVITTAAYRAGEIPAVDLPGPLAVRSSATIEDGARGAAPGLFETVLDVEPAELAEAVRAVWASANGPAVDAYLEARGIARADLAIAVIVQQQVGPAVERGTLYSRLPGDATSDRMLVERGDGTWEQLGREHDSDLADLARDAEAALQCDAVDIEFVRTADQLWIVQARPIPPLPVAPTPPPELFAFSKQEPDVVWRWDVAHNPDPLSPAQIGLVERVGGDSMRVVDGYLYVADRSSDAAPSPPLNMNALDEMESVLSTADGSLDAALAAFDGVYAIYTEALGPALRAARRELPDLLARYLPAEQVDREVHALLGATSAVRLETLVAAVAAGLATRDELLEVAAPFAPAWDVAVPTYGERPALLDAAIEHAHASTAAAAATAAEDRLRARLPASARDRFDEALAAARIAADLAELDDRYFARAQWLVRKALLDLGRGDDIFYTPLDEALSDDPNLAPATAARAAIERQRARAMPLAFRDGAPLPTAPTLSADAWRGRGCGGRARGRVTRLRSLADAPQLEPGAVLLVPAVTPAMTFLLHRASAIVSAHGGLLDHGAAIARELGLPCVVGCSGAWAQLSDGDEAYVDGNAGLVVRLGPG